MVESLFNKVEGVQVWNLRLQAFFCEYSIANFLRTIFHGTFLVTERSFPPVSPATPQL